MLQTCLELFLANTESLKSECLSFDELEFNSDVKAALVEVARCFKVIKQLEIVGDSQIRFEALFRLAFALKAFAIYQFVFKFD